MKTEENIKRLFAKVLEEHGNNKSAAAASLETNPVTFWGWVTGKRGLNKALCSAIDKAGGKLFLPGEDAPLSARQGSEREIERLREKADALARENALLHKLVKKYEADEHEKNKHPQTQDGCQDGPVLPAGPERAKQNNGVDTFPGAGQSV